MRGRWPPDKKERRHRSTGYAQAPQKKIIVPSMRKVLIITIGLVLCVGSPLSAKAPSKLFKNCTELRKSYPKGVAKTRAAAQQSGAKYNPTIYKENKSKDRHNDGAACEK